MRILIIRPAALGDTLMLLPALARMRGLAEVTLVARMPGLEYLRPSVHQCIDYERKGWHSLFVDEPFLTSNLAFPGMDLAVAFLSDLDGKVKNNLKAVAPGARIHVFPGFPRKEENLHAAFYLSRCLEIAGCPLDPQRALEEAEERPLLTDETFLDSQRKIVFHPGSGGITKNHPTDFWMTILQAFKYRFPSEKNPYVLLLGPAEEIYLSYYREQLKEASAEVLFSPEKERLTRLLGSARLYIGHDSGITHLAAMLGAPTIALFRSTNVHQWRPLGPRVKVIEERESSLVLIEEVQKAAREFFS